MNRLPTDADPATEIHVPPPSVWPVILAGGVTLLGFGVVTSLVFSALGLLLMIWALAGWIGSFAMPDPVPDSAPALLTRRGFLSKASAALTALAGAVVAVPILAYLLDPLIHPARQVWRDLGPVDQFQIGQTVLVTFADPSPVPWAGQTAQTAAWVRRNGETDFVAFAVTCTHLGCPVSWRGEAELFLCPCHGGVYYADGTVAGGPPPRPLFRYDLRIQNGTLQLLTEGLQVA